MWKTSSKILEASDSCRKIPTKLGEIRDTKLVSAVKSQTLTQLQGSNVSHLIPAQSVTGLWKRQREQQSLSSRKHQHLLCLHISIAKMISAWFHSWDLTGVFLLFLFSKNRSTSKLPIKTIFLIKNAVSATWAALTHEQLFHQVM